MAIAIKSVPIIKGKAAARIEKMAAKNSKKAVQFSFSMSASSQKILDKAQI